MDNTPSPRPILRIVFYLTLLVFAAADSIGELVEIPFLHAAALEKADIKPFQGEIETPEIAAVLVGSFVRSVDDTEVEVVRLA